MAVATQMRRGSDNRGHGSWMNIYVLSSTGIAPGSVLTLSGALTVTVQQELPYLGWKTQVTAMPVLGGRLRVRKDDAVTG